MSSIQPTDYDTPEALIDALQTVAWQHEPQFVEASLNRGTIHIPVAPDSTDTVCSHGPERSKSGNQARTPKNREVSHFGEAWRDGFEWCKYCLAKEYAGVDYRVLDKHLKKGSTGITVSARYTPQAYHTQECSHYPSQTREATVEERLALNECFHCQRETTGAHTGGGDRHRLTPRWRYECPECGCVRVFKLVGSQKRGNREYPANGVGARMAARDRRAAFSCKGCGAWLEGVVDKKEGVVVDGV